MPNKFTFCAANGYARRVDIVRFTRQLVDIESVTGNEAAAGEFLLRELGALGFAARPLPVDSRRFNVYAAAAPQPDLVFSTHMDTVPPFIPSSEDAENIYGRGSCDAKGIIAAQVAAAARLREQGAAVGLLFTVGEETDSAGAKLANHHAPGSRFMINGEPTDNRIAVATKGALHVELVARGRMAHSAYPELGESAAEKLLDALTRLRAMKLPAVDGIGPATLNIGLLSGGRAPNVVADEARASLLFRMVTPSDEFKPRILDLVGDLVEVTFPADSPFVRLRTVESVPTMVAAFSTDIPHLTNWGTPLLFGPGSIHVAHTEGEFLAKKEQAEAVELYVQIARRLLS